MATALGHRRAWPLCVLGLFCGGLSSAVAGDPAEFTYRSSVNEVRLNFSVVDQNNHGVATLQASDFAVVDKDVIVRKFQSFARSDWKKLEVAILIDNSESVTPSSRKEIPDIANLVSETAGIPDENFSIFSFHDVEPLLLCAGDCRGSGAVERLAAGRAGGLTPLFDTIVFASEFLAKRVDDHAEKILIVISDGADTVSRNSGADAVDAALRHDVRLDCIDVHRPFELSRGSVVLESLANATGGRYFSTADGVRHAMNVILEDFRASYEIRYRLPSHIYGFHAVRILPTHDRNLQFRSRSGYYYPNQVP